MSLHSKLELQPICLTHVEGLPSLGQAMWPRPLLVMAAVTLSEEVGTRRRFKKKKNLPSRWRPIITCRAPAGDWLLAPPRGGALDKGRGPCGQLPATVCRNLPARPRESPSRPARDPAASNVVNQMWGLLHSAAAADSS